LEKSKTGSVVKQTRTVFNSSDGVAPPTSKPTPPRSLPQSHVATASRFQNTGRNPTMSKSQNSKNESSLHRRAPVLQQEYVLWEWLLSTSFHAYARLVAKLLEALGYEHVELAGRVDWKGRNRDGGVDILASLPGGVAPRRIAIQLKQFHGDTYLYQRHIDELRGVALRLKASEALLISTGPLSPSVNVFALDDLPVPVRVIHGETLIRLLAQHRIGVTEAAEPDREFLKQLGDASPGNSPADYQGGQDFLVSVEIRPLEKSRPTRKKATLAGQYPIHL
jgi:Restriction endonuclease